MKRILAILALLAAGSVQAVDVETLIRELRLERHIEGGYYRRTFQADHRPLIDLGEGERYTMTSIYYLLTEESPIGHWHVNKSDILHFFHLGEPVTYYLVHPDGRLETVVLGPDPTQGHQLQMAVKGGTWKASHLAAGEYGLISEAVSPGFEYEDMTLGTAADLRARFPQLGDVIERFSKTAE